MAEHVLFQGAESKIFVKNVLGKQMLIKERFLKTYRNPILDTELTTRRINAEYRNIMRCKQNGIRTPAVYKIDMKKRQIFMEYLENAKTAKQVIYELEALNATEQLEKLAEAIGKTLEKMHSIQMIHGDLTSSNIMVTNDNITQITLIDFGLSSMNASNEDKAVDLYVLERALLSAHATGQEFFKYILQAYEKHGEKRSKAVLQKFEEVRARGRKRTMVG